MSRPTPARSVAARTGIEIGLYHYRWATFGARLGRSRGHTPPSPQPPDRPPRQVWTLTTTATAVSAHIPRGSVSIVARGGYVADVTNQKGGLSERWEAWV